MAVNADSLSSWFLPGVASVLSAHRLLLDIVVDDQDYTHEALTNGDVMGCVTTLGKAMRGCIAEPLGTMRYRCVAAPKLIAQWLEKSGRVSAHQLLEYPAVIFNRKDGLQDAFLAQHLKLANPLYPRHVGAKGVGGKIEDVARRELRDHERMAARLREDIHERERQFILEYPGAGHFPAQDFREDVGGIIGAGEAHLGAP